MKRITFLIAILLLALARSAQADFFQTFNTGGAVVPDGNLVGWSDTRDVSGVSGPIGDVSVTLNLSGGWNGDLYAYLVHDSGFAILLNRVGRDVGNAAGFGTAGMNVTLSDAAVLGGNIHSVSVPAPLGTYQPDGRNIDPQTAAAGFNNPLNPTALLSSFNGGNPNGNWTLFVADVASGDVTTVQSWGLNIALVPEPSSFVLLLLGGVIGMYRFKRVKDQPQPC
jgi:subtilisin-like proprotein convertase family protein